MKEGKIRVLINRIFPMTMKAQSALQTDIDITQMIINYATNKLLYEERTIIMLCY